MQLKENSALLMQAPVPKAASSPLFYHLKPPQTLLISAMYMQKLFLPLHTPPPLSPPPAA